MSSSGCHISVAANAVAQIISNSKNNLNLYKFVLNLYKFVLNLLKCN